MPRINNIEAYIAKRVQKELDKSLNAMIDQKIQKLQSFATIRQASHRHNRNSLNDMGKAIYQTQLQNLNLFQEFGNSESQFLNLFANEIKKSLFNNM